MTEPRLYRPTFDEKLAFITTMRHFDIEDEAFQIAKDQAERTGKTAFACYLAIARSL